LRLVRPTLNGARMQPREKTFQNVLQSAVRPEIIDAAREVSAHLTRSGIRHAIVGALAIGVYTTSCTLPSILPPQ